MKNLMRSRHSPYFQFSAIRMGEGASFEQLRLDNQIQVFPWRLCFSSLHFHNIISISSPPLATLYVQYSLNDAATASYWLLCRQSCQAAVCRRVGQVITNQSRSWVCRVSEESERGGKRETQRAKDEEEEKEGIGVQTRVHMFFSIKCLGSRLGSYL